MGLWGLPRASGRVGEGRVLFFGSRPMQPCSRAFLSFNAAKAPHPGHGFRYFAETAERSHFLEHTKTSFEALAHTRQPSK